MTYRGQVKNGVVVLEGQPALPDGTIVDVQPVAEAAATQSLWEGLLDFAGTVKGLPADMAEQHDHYIHGTPKRTNS